MRNRPFVMTMHPTIKRFSKKSSGDGDDLFVQPPSRIPRLIPLAACLASALALTAPATWAATRAVANCADSGFGSLRQVVGVAVSFDTVDLSALTCSTITLTSGEVAIPQYNLTLQGPIDRNVTINTSSNTRILHHTGAAGGVLIINYLTISGGKYAPATGNAKGGCILSSSASVNLNGSTVSGCATAVAASGSIAKGGAIYAAISIDMLRSTVTGNRAIASGTGTVALGGGIYAHGVFANLSTVSGNRAYDSATGGGTFGGGILVEGNMSLYSSTVDSNQAQYGGGIYQLHQAGGVNTVTIANSTISGNQATSDGGGLRVKSPLTLYNSTIAFNSASKDAGILSYASVVSQSSIIANNTNTSSASFGDLYIKGSGLSLTGANNLIVSSNLLLAGTLTSDPRLVPLGNHGGATRTHALSSNSPAIDKGNNAAHETFDQRETGFLRVVGPSADIGAYERQVNDDEIFYDGFQ